MQTRCKPLFLGPLVVGGALAFAACSPSEPAALGQGLEACPLAQPHFAFDRDTARLADSDDLAAFAECMSAPGREHLSLVLIGPTDSEGSDAHNQRLGMDRAESVKAKLVQYGVEPSRITVQSSGEAAATAENDAFSSQGYERRVDIVQIGVVQAPAGSDESLAGDH